MSMKAITAKKIPLTQGKFALVDDEDFNELSQIKWCYHQGYAVRGVDSLAMHRAIMKPDSNMEIDHINGNGCDNRRCNLRVATKRENGRNRGPNKRNKTGYKGVSFCKRTGKYQAQIRSDSGNCHLGRYKTPEEAANAYNIAAKDYHREFAYQNRIGGDCY